MALDFKLIAKKMKREAGFTLVEMLLTVAALSIIAVVAIPFTNSSLVRGNFDASSRVYENALRKAYAYARASRNDTDWGVYTASSSVTVFSGSTYAGRSAALDESNEYAYPLTVTGTIASGGIAEVVFAKGSGLPSATGTVVVENGGNSKTFTMNAAGAILVQ